MLLKDFLIREMIDLRHSLGQLLKEKSTLLSILEQIIKKRRNFPNFFVYTEKSNIKVFKKVIFCVIANFITLKNVSSLE